MPPKRKAPKGKGSPKKGKRRASGERTVLLPMLMLSGAEDGDPGADGQPAGKVLSPMAEVRRSLRSSPDGMPAAEPELKDALAEAVPARSTTLDPDAAALLEQARQQTAETYGATLSNCEQALRRAVVGDVVKRDLVVRAADELLELLRDVGVAAAEMDPNEAVAQAAAGLYGTARAKKVAEVLSEMTEVGITRSYLRKWRMWLGGRQDARVKTLRDMLQTHKQMSNERVTLLLKMKEKLDEANNKHRKKAAEVFTLKQKIQELHSKLSYAKENVVLDLAEQDGRAMRQIAREVERKADDRQDSTQAFCKICARSLQRRDTPAKHPTGLQAGNLHPASAFRNDQAWSKLPHEKRRELTLCHMLSGQRQLNDTIEEARLLQNAYASEIENAFTDMLRAYRDDASFSRSAYQNPHTLLQSKNAILILRTLCVAVRTSAKQVKHTVKMQVQSVKVSCSRLGDALQRLKRNIDITAPQAEQMLAMFDDWFDPLVRSLSQIDWPLLAPRELRSHALLDVGSFARLAGTDLLEDGAPCFAELQSRLRKVNDVFLLVAEQLHELLTEKETTDQINAARIEEMEIELRKSRLAETTTRKDIEIRNRRIQQLERQVTVERQLFERKILQLEEHMQDESEDEDGCMSTTLKVPASAGPRGKGATSPQKETPPGLPQSRAARNAPSTNRGRSGRAGDEFEPMRPRESPRPYDSPAAGSPAPQHGTADPQQQQQQQRGYSGYGSPPSRQGTSDGFPPRGPLQRAPSGSPALEQPPPRHGPEEGQRPALPRSVSMARRSHSPSRTGIDPAEAGERLGSRPGSPEGSPHPPGPPAYAAGGAAGLPTSPSQGGHLIAPPAQKPAGRKRPKRVMDELKLLKQLMPETETVSTQTPVVKSLSTQSMFSLALIPPKTVACNTAIFVNGQTQTGSDLSSNTELRIGSMTADKAIQTILWGKRHLGCQTYIVPTRHIAVGPGKASVAVATDSHVWPGHLDGTATTTTTFCLATSRGGEPSKAYTYSTYVCVDDEAEEERCTNPSEDQALTSVMQLRAALSSCLLRADTIRTLLGEYQRLWGQLRDRRQQQQERELMARIAATLPTLRGVPPVCFQFPAHSAPPAGKQGKPDLHAVVPAEVYKQMEWAAQFSADVALSNRPPNLLSLEPLGGLQRSAPPSLPTLEPRPPPRPPSELSVPSVKLRGSARRSAAPGSATQRSQRSGGRTPAPPSEAATESLPAAERSGVSNPPLKTPLSKGRLAAHQRQQQQQLPPPSPPPLVLPPMGAFYPSGQRNALAYSQALVTRPSG